MARHRAALRYKELCKPIHGAGRKGWRYQCDCSTKLQSKHHRLWKGKALAPLRHVHHGESHATHVRAAVETWAPGCDGFVAFSTESDPSLNAVKIEHRGEEAYMNMWQKLRSIWTYVYGNYGNDYDFFFAGGEDLYVLPQNLRDFLTGKDPSSPQLLGRRFRTTGGICSTGWAGVCREGLLLHMRSTRTMPCVVRP